MKAEVIKTAVTEEISSASGIEVIDGMIYIVGEKSPTLYFLDPYLNLKKKIDLYKTANGKENGSPEQTAPDLKGVTHFKINGYPHLLLLGSGSRPPYDDTAFLVKLPTPYNRNHLVWQKDLSELYNLFRVNDEIDQEGQLNIEEVATGSDFIVLYNRLGLDNRNSALYFSLLEFVEFIQGHTESVPFPLVHSYELPKEGSRGAGFSAATIFDNKLFLAGIFEETEDVKEGEVDYKAIAGWKAVQSFQQVRGMEAEPLAKAAKVCTIQVKDITLKEPIKSLGITEKVSESQYAALGLTTDKNGQPKLLLIDIYL